jgi:hypothetical protein
LKELCDKSGASILTALWVSASPLLAETGETAASDAPLQFNLNTVCFFAALWIKRRGMAKKRFSLFRGFYYEQEPSDIHEWNELEKDLGAASRVASRWQALAEKKERPTFKAPENLGDIFQLLGSVTAPARAGLEKFSQTVKDAEHFYDLMSDWPELKREEYRKKLVKQNPSAWREKIDDLYAEWKTFDKHDFADEKTLAEEYNLTPDELAKILRFG